MKTKTVVKKLNLKKETVSDLENTDMSALQGGKIANCDETCTSCGTQPDSNCPIMTCGGCDPIKPIAHDIGPIVA